MSDEQTVIESKEENTNDNVSIFQQYATLSHATLTKFKGFEFEEGRTYSIVFTKEPIEFKETALAEIPLLTVQIDGVEQKLWVTNGSINTLERIMTFIQGKVGESLTLRCTHYHFEMVGKKRRFNWATITEC